MYMWPRHIKVQGHLYLKIPMDPFPQMTKRVLFVADVHEKELRHRIKREDHHQSGS